MTSDSKPDRPKDGLGDVPLYLSPYELWNFGRGKGYAFPGIRKWSKYITALAEFPPRRRNKSDPTSTIDSNGFNTWLPTLWHPSSLSFTPFVVEKPLGADDSPKGLQDLLQKALQRLASIIFPAEAKFVDIKKARFRVAFPVPDRAMHCELPPRGPKDPDWHCDKGLRDRIGEGKRITIMAVIDDGLPFAHRNFRDATGERTRVEFCWLQSVEADSDQKSVLFGREYTRDQVEKYIADFGHDEDALYREAGATIDTEDLGSLIDRHATHGAHVMDLATGYAAERGEEPAEEIRIIAVQLPNTIAWDTSGFGKDMYMLSAFHYIFHRADIIADAYGIDNPRLVINFSYGFSGGRHDGRIELEAAIDQLVAKRRECRGPTALVLPAGNIFLERMHGRICPADLKDEARLAWRIQPNDRTPSYLELWFGENFDPAGYSIELRDPWDRLRFSKGIESSPSSPDEDLRQADSLVNDDGAPVGQISADWHRRERWRVLVIMAPTEPEDASLPGVECGEWTVVIKRDGNGAPLDEPIHCWVQRAADPESLRSGSRQSYFDDLKNTRYTADGDLKEEDTDNAFVRRFGSLNGLATGCTSLIVAGYRLGAGLGSQLEYARPARYSSAGTLEPGWPQAKVDCSSMSDRSRVLAGTVAAGVRSGSRSFVQGTSAAAPFVARQLATVFATADDDCVAKAAVENYRSLLSGYWEPSGNDDLSKARLGAVRVPPHWQPSLESECEAGMPD